MMETRVTVETPKTKWITPDEYKAYMGSDLNLRLSADDMGSGAAERFILRVENDVETYIASNFYRVIRFNDMTPFQRRHFKIGLMYQVQYAIDNGDMGDWSGLDEQGKHIERHDILNVMISPKAKQEFVLAGLMSRHIGGGVYDGWLGN